ncbi:hypothetical protein K2173_012638 [Erythroxylum novogranatense]|uniref:Glycosyltransferase n=1 Tax=Erythroxylum novogranatense TaxID=1862640 RepID=A0AAV8TJN1_9ROSI|nr:hypothetical protein K2173_012638 [Erythroxylum novogranatense]
MDHEKRKQLHIFFFPFMIQGHIIPVLDMAKLFASRGVKTSFVTTPANAALFSKSVESMKSEGHNSDILIINFPVKEAGLPDGFESFDSAETREMSRKSFLATSFLAQPLDQLLEEHRPSCIVADMLFPWATGVASKHGIPRLVFHGTCCFSVCATECVRVYEPHRTLSSDDDVFVIPGLPGEIRLKRKQLPVFMRLGSEFCKFYGEIKKSELESFGVLVNSFYELEQVYVDYYRDGLGRKAWHIGPLALCHNDIESKANRGKEASIDKNKCLEWLNSKKPISVVYVCFGSLANFESSQLLEIARALEDSKQYFIWVVKRERSGEDTEDWLPEGYEIRNEGKGLIIRGWSPQLMILEHEAVGAFVTHCGWNSTLEAITVGVPMVTWPVAAEQFYNEKLVTEVLRIGVPVGAQKWARRVGDSIKKEAIEKAVTRTMTGQEGDEMRNRARKFGETAKRAVKEGGSSYTDLSAFIEELKQISNLR